MLPWDSPTMMPTPPVRYRPPPAIRLFATCTLCVVVASVSVPWFFVPSRMPVTPTSVIAPLMISFEYGSPALATNPPLPSMSMPTLPRCWNEQPSNVTWTESSSSIAGGDVPQALRLLIAGRRDHVVRVRERDAAKRRVVRPFALTSCDNDGAIAVTLPAVSPGERHVR